MLARGRALSSRGIAFGGKHMAYGVRCRVCFVLLISRRDETENMRVESYMAEGCALGHTQGASPHTPVGVHRVISIVWRHLRFHAKGGVERGGIKLTLDLFARRHYVISWIASN
jgi:hypothetical protein